MAAKKAPAKKMAAPAKAAPKKTGSAAGSAVGKKMTGSAAQFRMKEEADKAKAYNNPSNKDAKDARGRATKYGTPVGETKVVSSGKPFKSRPNTELVEYKTTVVKNGVRYAVVETKDKTKGGPDKRSTRVTKSTK
jgi:hypothetical protein